MRILVLGATGYVGSRLVPALIEEGHDVVAASSSAPAPERFSWGHEVEWVRCDVTSAEDVAAALEGIDGVCYLVHSLNIRGFSERDRIGAETVRAAVDASGVRRVVYLSGLVPDIPRERLSGHIASRLEVEEELLRVDCSAVALRAGVVVGAGSTSFEVIRQLATLLLVQPVPLWLRTSVQPIAVTDFVRALVAAFEPEAEQTMTGAVDIGGPDVLPYPRLLAEYSRAAGMRRLRVPIPVAPVPAVSVGTAALVQAPFHTVAALVESLRDDMVCRPEAMWRPRDERPLLTVREAMERALDPIGQTLERPLDSDPAWTRMRAPVLDTLRAPLHWRAGVSLALHRLRELRD